MIKAIETVYNGYRFRSRLEARWAVFFDTLGIKYEYEKEGFDLDGVWYLPDFWLPDLDCWVEIKGPNPTKEEQIKLATLTNKNTSWNGILRIGTPDAIGNEGFGYTLGKCIGYQVFVECLECGKIGYILYNETFRMLATKETFIAPERFMYGPPKPIKWQEPFMLGRLRCNCRKRKYGSWDITDYQTSSPRIEAAYTAARQARFEHGERP